MDNINALTGEWSNYSIIQSTSCHTLECLNSWLFFSYSVYEHWCSALSHNMSGVGRIIYSKYVQNINTIDNSLCVRVLQTNTTEKTQSQTVQNRAWTILENYI